MARSIFGWDYPPGCNSVPGDEPDPPCEVCCNDIDDCICPECQICGAYGDPLCYIEHGLRRTWQQKMDYVVNQRQWEMAARDDNLSWDRYVGEAESIFDEPL
jgi:hypothetical protein